MKALDEVQAAETGPAEKRSHWLSRIFLRAARAVGMGGAGVLAGSIVAGPESFTLVIGLMVAGSIGLTLRDRDARPERSSLVDVLILLLTFLFTWGRRQDPSSSVEFGKLLVFGTGALVSLAGSVLLPRLRGPLTPEPKQEFTATA
jgi:hypothetical protein